MDDDRATVRLVDRLLADAVRRRASDIHLQPEADRIRVRLRIDGLLREAEAPPAALHGRIAARIKLLAGMDVAEQRLPQDGRLEARDGDGHRVQFRVASCPGVHGEKLVLRLIEQDAPTTLEALGLPDPARQALEAALDRPDGLILVTGPTGSGKTATLHAALRRLNTPERNICAVEDPVELDTPGVTHVAVNRRAGIDFARALRAFLRQDPDVIMVGEIRDAETAAIAVKAAQTGHLVLSTLHTRSAPGAVERLAQMGLPGHDLASSLSLVVAQRLVRRLCPTCRDATSSPAQPAAAEPPGDYARRGCSQCQDGYCGRRGIFQVMPLTRTVADAVLAGASAREIETRARADGIPDLHDAGWPLVEAGETSATELRRVTHEADSWPA
ncbi:MAG: GspE/PulE family protein [Halorhodospira halophila]|uniref:GspE/PulE family protein n=1 Tax=Halorhodospira TaxID=85108 RepID=UPI001EE91CAB|nr:MULTISPECIES: GspE/PulE family protein [Halorhodospira]MCC3750122.1 GspE/PulE family protein [Halorhodospira halophila]MCG5527548.1 GspE/PulE family protein [Halorhodospira halophila]MCG5544375.1 GspE/PulE family protein [Halorhodospira sp. 9628]